MIIFENDGEIEPLCMTTFGVNVKERENAIGTFGTGFKYAIPVLLRTGHSVVVYSGLRVLNFFLEEVNIRGKRFDLIKMHDGQSPPVDMGITTELGKRWEVWMAYRELRCNAVDEGGLARHHIGSLPKPISGKTYIIVEGDAIEQVHLNRSLYFVEGQPAFSCYNGEIHIGTNHGIFYRGVRVAQLKEPTALTYNILAETKLTEDRTAESEWDLSWNVRQMILQCDKDDILKIALSAPKGSYENNLNLSMRAEDASKTFLDVTASLIRSNPSTLNSSASQIYHERVVSQLAPVQCQLSSYEDSVLSEAIDFVGKLINVGNKQAMPVYVAESLGEGKTSLVKDGAIYLSRGLFGDDGDVEVDKPRVASALVQEILQRSVQKLADELVALGNKFGV